MRYFDRINRFKRGNDGGLRTASGGLTRSGKLVVRNNGMGFAVICLLMLLALFSVVLGTVGDKARVLPLAFQAKARSAKNVWGARSRAVSLLFLFEVKKFLCHKTFI
ncbi:hypothetical protein [Pseudomonas sp. 2FG]|uniref:hypothetical protein n=1 Tax=Pseudomonas sp. 2FG TaxID=2502191 RepID=UPI0010F97967|nr:hypothetical protein [Pseudomonas sp. 2FG]